VLLELVLIVDGDGPVEPAEDVEVEVDRTHRRAFPCRHRGDVDVDVAPVMGPTVERGDERPPRGTSIAMS